MIKQVKACGRRWCCPPCPSAPPPAALLAILPIKGPEEQDEEEFPSITDDPGRDGGRSPYASSMPGPLRGYDEEEDDPERGGG